MTLKWFEVGGCIRDEILGLPIRDVDFTVEAPSFEAMVKQVADEGLDIKVEKPEHFTIKAVVPKGHWLRKKCADADFVLARRDGPSSDGRRPDFVEAGTLLDDLQRRDFTINAMARKLDTNEVIDPFGGRLDLEHKVLRFVGNPFDRIDEDGLRVLRGFRFMVTKGLTLDPVTDEALHSKAAVQAIARSSVATERIAIELRKMFEHDTMRSIDVVHNWPPDLRNAIFRGGVRLTATMKAVK